MSSSRMKSLAPLIAAGLPRNAGLVKGGALEFVAAVRDAAIGDRLG